MVRHNTHSKRFHLVHLWMFDMKRTFEKFEEILKLSFFPLFVMRRKRERQGFFNFFVLRNFAKVLPQGSDPEEESRRFISATNL
jgi:hypothetical protein